MRVTGRLGSGGLCVSGRVAGGGPRRQPIHMSLAAARFP